MGRVRRRGWFSGVSVAGSVCAVAALAAEPPVPVVDPAAVFSLAGPWKFRTGDNLAWAGPRYDDAGWQDVQVPAGWSRHHPGGHVEFAWYRREVRIASRGHGLTPDRQAAQRLGLTLGKIDSAYEVYAGGIRL